jgi:hypothetical protein
MSGARDASNLLLSVCMMASVSSLVMRYRRSGGEVRQQIKWIAFAASVVALGVSGAVVLGTFAAGTAAGTHPLLIGLLEDAITLSFAGVPIAVGFAVLKYRLYNIDVIINRTLVYGSLTATLVALYFVGIGKTLEAFSAQLRDETDLNALSDDLVGVVRETMQPSYVSLWLRPDSSTKGQQTD